MLFELTREHLNKGRLSDTDFSSVAGSRVVSFALSDFPHLDAIRSGNRFGLYELQLDRCKTIYAALQKEGMISPSGAFGWGDAKAVATQTFATVRSMPDHNITTSQFSRFRHFEAIQKQGFDAAHQKNSDLWVTIRNSSGNMSTGVLPGLLNEDIQVHSLSWKKSSFILRDDAHSSLDYWANTTRLPVHIGINTPSEGMHQLLCDLHEQRHLQQISFQRSSVTDFYCELDADLSANAALSKAGVGAQTRVANLHSRYMDMLFTPQHYWFAASMEALEDKRTPQDFYTTVRAVAEIRMRLALDQMDEDPAISSGKLQNSFAEWDSHPGNSNPDGLHPSKVEDIFNTYDLMVRRHYQLDAPEIYTNLRHLIDCRAFTDPFTEKLAIKILEAANYFNPDLLRVDEEPVRQRMQRPRIPLDQQIFDD